MLSPYAERISEMVMLLDAKRDQRALMTREIDAEIARIENEIEAAIGGEPCTKPARGDHQVRILAALESRAKDLHQLAAEVYGSDTSDNRINVSRHLARLKQYGKVAAVARGKWTQLAPAALPSEVKP